MSVGSGPEGRRVCPTYMKYGGEIIITYNIGEKGTEREMHHRLKIKMSRGKWRAGETNSKENRV